MIKMYHFIAGATLLFCIQACTERAICPAFQSAFIHDKDVLKQRFSYFGEDSLPKIMEASKDQFLIIEPMAYRKKLRTLQTIPMQDVYPQKDKDDKFDDEFYLAGQDSSGAVSADALVADSVYMISLKKEDFNIDQELYLWYLREHLVYPDVRLQMQRNFEQRKIRAREERREKGIFGFFRRLFKKKEASDSTIFDVETSATELNDSESKDKKGLFDFLKKNEKSSGETQNDEAVPAQQPRNEDEGEDDF